MQLLEMVGIAKAIEQLLRPAAAGARLKWISSLLHLLLLLIVVDDPVREYEPARLSCLSSRQIIIVVQTDSLWLTGIVFADNHYYAQRSERLVLLF